MKTYGTPELVAAHRQLSGLVKKTKVYIGGVASHGYGELNKLPAAGHHPMDIPPTGFYSDSRFFKGRRIVRAAALLGGPVSFGESGARITETSTETYQRRHYGSSWQPTLRLPASDRLVTVDIETPNQAASYLPPTVSISTHGYATFNRRTDNTEPRVTAGNLADKHFGYQSPEALRADYVQKYTGALAVTNIVVTSLSLAHGIETDVSGIRILVEEWQQTSPEGARALDPAMAVFLPRGSIES